MVEGVRCIQPLFSSQMLMKQASKYITAAGKHVSDSLEGPNDKTERISAKLYCGHARSDLLPQVVEGVRCIQPLFSSQMLMTVASKYVSAAGKHVSDTLGGPNDDTQCISANLYCGHARSDLLPQVVEGISAFSHCSVLKCL